MFKTTALSSLSVGTATYTVLTIGDSWGDTGPTYKIIKDVFDKNGVPVDSKNRAVGGTTACGWASKTKSDKTSTTFEKGQGLVNAALEEFGEDGPDFVWYTLGGNDLAGDGEYHDCLDNATTEDAAHKCLKTSSDKAYACTVALLEPFFARFPKSKLMQHNYDVVCESPLCESIIVGGYLGGKFCNGDKTCQNKQGLYWYSVYVQELQKQFPQPQYTGLNIFGTSQMANGIPGAAPGNPVLDRDSGDCKVAHEILCIHPAYGTKMATAIGDEYWRSFFSKHIASNSTLV